MRNEIPTAIAALRFWGIDQLALGAIFRFGHTSDPLLAKPYVFVTREVALEGDGCGVSGEIRSIVNRFCSGCN